MRGNENLNASGWQNAGRLALRRGIVLLNVAINWRKAKRGEENALKGDIYNGCDFTARREPRGSRDPRRNGGLTGGREGGETAE